MTISIPKSLREANQLYERLVELPTFQRAAFAGGNVVQLDLSCKDHTSLTTKTKSGSIVVDRNPPVATPFAFLNPSIKREFAIAGLQDWKVSLREEPNEKTKRFVDIWDNKGVRRRSVEVTEAHGAFVKDDVFSTFSATASGQGKPRIHILYSAASNAPEPDVQNPLERYALRPSIGEKYARTLQPAVFSLSVGGNRESSIYLLSSDRESRIWSSAVFLPATNGVGPTQAVAVAHDTLPNHRRLGEVFCSNRPMSVWRIPLPLDDGKEFGKGEHDPFEKLREAKIHSVSDGSPQASEGHQAEQLSSKANSARCPRVAPANKGQGWSLIWLETPLGGPHSNASHVFSAAGHDSQITQAPKRMLLAREEQERLSSNENCGVYIDQLPAQPFFQDPNNGDRLFGATTIDGCKRRAVIVDLSGRERDLSIQSDLTEGDGNLSFTFLAGETDGSRFLLQSSGPSQPPQLLLGNIASPNVSLEVIYQVQLSDDDASVSKIRSQIVAVPGSGLAEKESLDTREIQAILLRRPESESTDPCILLPHGGPHSTTTTDWSAGLAAMVMSGHSIVLPNYHGSLGRSPAFVTSLVGRCGELDIADSIKTIDHVITLGLASKDNVYYQGGSHGGFIGAHLLTREPQRWRAVSLRNPVTHIGDMWSETDIPDWCVAELGEDFNFDDPPCQLGKARYEKLHDASPLPHVDDDLNGSTPVAKEQQQQLPPTLLCIASSDQRVPPTQGLSFYHSLRSRNLRDGSDPAHKRTHCCWFEDPDAGHGLESIETARGAWGATWSWFAQWQKE
ncbi:unnamed protein product [Sympodiomycopsis kandeliae]